MVKDEAETLDAVFHALSDPTRRAILRRLSRGEATISDLARPFPTSLPAISKHIKVLEDAGLIARRAEGRERICTLEAKAMTEATEWMEYYRRFWNERLDALDDFLQEEQRSAAETPTEEDNQ